MRDRISRPAGILLGFLFDRLTGDPQRFHPVSGFGSVATYVERAMYRDSRARGVGFELIMVGGPTVLGFVAERSVRHPLTRTVLIAGVTWAVLGGRSLAHEAGVVDKLLASGDLSGARVRLTRLVGRDTRLLSETEIARAVIESVAENTSDAVVAPLFWGAVAGVPGLVMLRAANTLDAMVGHRSPRLERFGWAAARFDDLLGLPAARVTAVVASAIGPDTRGALRCWRRDAQRHPSPNAGVVEAAFAGALGLRLGGVNRYPGRAPETRAVMGDGRSATRDDIGRTVMLAQRVGVSTAAAVAIAAARMGDRRRGIAPLLR
ncbi:adenosylcobinamide-phosphate synthase CbiB [Gordonia sp. ABSL11-1]|uniref:adenosylcobinamide-phosphate synthase CbiB n=1 Tax=Gordonia sp. ABSL11-1 TaxID=3053924 RepID=UPI00257316CC|nr:adenosylcobinamide-phosphate synthase CbiB [Gordonia sp. ABSL11-1]MDL9948471.1 adenosylcobinamide-phosphate synthase CbiB [Gordonia sp. ABSL11-1]